MEYIISVVSPDDVKELSKIHKQMDVPIFLTVFAHGTAVQSMLDLLGIDSNERRIIIAVANSEKAEKLIKEIKRRLYIGVPGHGIVVSVPIKSIGGGKSMSILSEGEMPKKELPKTSSSYELIVAVANEGRTDTVMNAARAAGAAGGTVIHGKGTASEEAAHFFNISIASEKEMIFIVSKKEQKAQIMRSVLEKAGPGTEAGAVLFSLPVTSVEGFGLFED